MKKYEGNMMEYVETMKKYKEIIKKYIGRRTEKFRAFPQEGKSYANAYADTIPGMALSTKKKGGSSPKFRTFPLYIGDEFRASL